MASVTRTTTWIDNQVLTASALNGEFNNLLNALNLVDADISGGAAISASKIADTAVTLTAGQTISNKAINAYQMNAGTIRTSTLVNLTVQASTQVVTSYTPSGGGTSTLDLSGANLHFITMPAGNITIALSNSAIGKVFLVRIKQDSGGSRTVTWFTTINWVGGTVPTLTTTGGKADVFGFIST